MKSKITLKDIAKEFGVSTSTVSKALNDSHEISTETKERIKAYAKYYNYKPNSLALKLRNQKTSVIGVIIPEIVHHFFSTVLRGIEEYANGRGYNVMVCLSNNSLEKERLSIETLLEGSVDGILLSVTHETQRKESFTHLENLVQDKFPVVLFDNIAEDLNCDMVSIDDEGGAFKATEYLIEKGCKRICLLAIPDYVKIGYLRKQGYLKALKKHNIDIDEDLILEFGLDDDIPAIIESVFTDNNYPDAILATNGEIYASTAMQVAKDKGFKIPDDIRVITFTDGLVSKYSSPPLTTLVQHGFEMGRQAVELLIDRIESKDAKVEFQKKVISTNLKLRKSTEPV